MPHRDPVTHDVRWQVLLRDRECVVVKLGLAETPCRNRWGMEHSPAELDFLTLDHVHDGYGCMGRRAPSRLSNLVAVCNFHHLGGASTTKSARAAIRDYLKRVS